MAIELLPAADLRADRQDWLEKAYYQPKRDKQLAFAMVEAAVKNMTHPLAVSVGRLVKNMR